MAIYDTDNIENFNIDKIIHVFEKYFAYNTEKMKTDLRIKLEKNFTTGFNQNCLIRSLNSVTPFLHPEEEIDEKLKRAAGRAFLDKPDYLDESSGAVESRLYSLFKDIDRTGINIYKTIYKTTLRFGDVKGYRTEDGEEKICDSETRYFRNIYRAVQNSLDLSDEETISMFEQAAATLIGSVSTDKVYRVKEGLRRMIWEDDVERKLYYFFSDKDIKNGLMNCPSLYDANPDNFIRVFNYVDRHITEERINKEIERRKAKDGTILTPARARRSILQSIFLDNFSAFRMKVDKMYEKEKYIKSVPDALGIKLNFDFLFDDPIRIMCIDEIQDKMIYANAKQNIVNLFWHVKKNENVLRQYIYDNPYIFGMNRENFKALLEKIKLSDEQLGGTVLFGKFLKLGKTLFANKHYIDFDVDKVMEKLKEKDAMERLDVSKDDKDILEKFCSVFYGEDADEKYQDIMNMIYYRELREDNGYSRVRKIIRGAAEENGGWKEIVKSPTKALKMYYDISGIWSLRHQVENMEFTGTIQDVAKQENRFAQEMQNVLNDMRAVYAQKKAKLNKKYVNIEDLYNFAIMEVEREFADIKPMSQLVEEELVEPFRKALKEEYSETFSSQPTLFGGVRESVDVPSGRVSNLRKLNDEIAKNRDFKLEDSTIQIDRQK